MTIRSLLPWYSRKKKVPVRREEYSPVDLLHEEIDNLFDRFFHGFELEPFWSREREFVPRIDVSENDKDVIISAELPGINEKDIDLSLTEGTLTIRGEKKVEKEEKDKDYYRMERSYGSFSRSIPIPEYVDLDKVDARFKKGVLRITLPKVGEAEGKRRRIPIKTED